MHLYRLIRVVFSGLFGYIVSGPSGACLLACANGEDPDQLHIQSNFNGSNIIGTIENFSRYG